MLHPEYMLPDRNFDDMNEEEIYEYFVSLINTLIMIDKFGVEVK